MYSLSIENKFMNKKNDENFETFLLKIGENIKSARENKGITQAQMYLEPYSFERRNWQRIESGRKNITLKTLFHIAKKLNIPPKDLLDIE